MAMRDTARALAGVMLVVCCSRDMAAAETGSKWWPFGRHEETTVAQPPGAVAPTAMPLFRQQPTGAMAGSGMSTAAPIHQQPQLQQQTQLPQDPTDTSTERRWMVDSPFRKASWPRLALPKPQLPQTKLWLDKSETEAARNAWVEKSPEPTKPSPLQAMKDGAHRVGDSTKTAWHKTVDALTPGDSSSQSGSRIARREIRPPFWKRMLGAKEAELQGPQTIPEWMAQRRLEP